LIYSFIRFYRNKTRFQVKNLSKSLNVMGNQDSAVWKVNGEDKYFKRVSDTKWAEYVNGRHVFDFDFLGNDGDVVYLKKCGWYTYISISLFV